MNHRSAEEGFAAALAAANSANDAIIAGRAEPLKACFSHREDISLFGGFGGHEVGWSQIGPRLDWVAQSFAGGSVRYETVLRSVGSDHGCIVQFERGEARLAGRAAPLRLDFRVTMVFRVEDGEWKLIHRHADHLFAKQKPA